MQIAKGDQTRRSAAKRSIWIATIAFGFTTSVSAPAWSQGTADQAKAMLAKAVAAVKADKAKSLDEFNNGTGGFLVGDLYPFCFNISDGKLVAVANPNAKNLIGTDGRTLKDANGKPFGVEQFASAQKPEGEVTVTDYVFPKPGADKTPVAKESFTTKVGDLVCGVGYYK
jgi:signal transduction histidine kinase